MISWLNLLSGLGMVTVGVGAMVYWYYKKRISPVYFILGGILWAIAIAIKVVMDVTVSAALAQQAMIIFAPLAASVLLGLYYGLRTGILESGISYLTVRFTKLSKSGFDEAVALGIGFGGTEAALLGLLSLINTAALLMMPELVATLPASTLEQFALIMVPVPIIERLFTLFCHVFATVLLVYAARFHALIWLAVSILYKTLLDGVLPISSYLLAGMGTYAKYGIIELFVIVMGIIGLAGLLWIRKKWLTRAPEGNRTIE
ncbi:YhfC family glutamic-type intramembrane protease [Methanocella sp. MCL-LM]|uniref:YhfC family glutamic-type intramembrane protease n=1 Tax=Methanocella sp. MCL-LM TaxID=3412035 RepID=UPI003C7191A3